MPFDPVKARQYLDDIAVRTASLRQMLDEPVPSPTVIRVKVGDDLQKALDSAKGGDTIRIAPGSYKGNYILPARPVNDVAPVVIRPDVEDATLAVPSGKWITKDYAPALARLESGDG